MSIETTVRASRGPDRAKTVTVLSKVLGDTFMYVTWTSLGVALLVSTSRFGKYV